MKRRRTLAVGAITLALLALTGVGIAFAINGGSSSSSSRLASGNSVPRMRAHNLKLEQIVLLLEQHGPRATHARLIESGEPSGPLHSTAKVAERASRAAPDPSPEPEETGCDSNYEGECLNPDASDYDCEGGTGDGPEYSGAVTVVGEDHFGLDADGDGVGCEPE